MGSTSLWKRVWLGVPWLMNDQQISLEGQLKPKKGSGNVFLSRFNSRICGTFWIMVHAKCSFL